MRRKDREITDFTKMIDIVEDCICCRLGLVSGGRAYIVPMNFGYDADAATGSLTLYFHCAREGKKLEILRNDPETAFELDSGARYTGKDSACSFTCLYRCVMGSGRVVFPEEPERKLHALDRIMAHCGYKGIPEYDERALSRVCVFELKVDEWTAKEHN